MTGNDEPNLAIHGCRTEANYGVIVDERDGATEVSTCFAEVWRGMFMIVSRARQSEATVRGMKVIA